MPDNQTHEFGCPDESFIAHLSIDSWVFACAIA